MTPGVKGGVKLSVAERFWSKVRRTDGCWLWTASVSKAGGYGLLRVNGATRTTHRISWEIAYGPIPVGLSVLHRCDVPACVRPSHLFLGTQQDNLRDMHSKGRGRGPGRAGTPPLPLTKEH